MTILNHVWTETPLQRESLAAKLLEIGKGTLRAAQAADGDKNKIQNAKRWIQKAFAVVEHCEDTGETNMGELKVLHKCRISAYRQL